MSFPGATPPSAAPNAPTVRAFVALLLGPERGAELLAAARATLDPPSAYRFPREEGLHLTLLFLGDVASEPLAAFWERVRAELAVARRPELLVDRAGGFPSARRARVLWLGASERAGTEGRLARLHAGVRRAAAASSELARVLPRETQDLAAHVTVARPRGAPADPGPRFLGLAPRVAWTPEGVHLVESVRAGGGPAVYRALAELELG